MSLRVAKHASDKQATCPPSHLLAAETRNVSVVSQKNLRVSLAANFVARYKVSEVAKLGDSEGSSMLRVTCLLV